MYGEKSWPISLRDGDDSHRIDISKINNMQNILVYACSFIFPLNIMEW